MIKKLDKLILKSFLGPFIITFFIALFVLMMQILWKYIDDLVGKGLDFLTIGKFLWYATLTLVTLAMPIAILISTIMTFGNLGESFELVAIKSAGISLLRFMRPLIWVACILSFITFLFANYIIPTSQLKFVTLYNDIYYKKPAFDLKEGVFFSQIPGFVIKAGEKEKDNSTIHNVVIYEQSNPLQDNAIVAKTGVMKTSENANFLEFNLKDGYRYEENGQMGDTTTEFIRLRFKEFKKLFDLSVLKMQTTPDSMFKNNSRMLSARQLVIFSDSLNKRDDSLSNKLFTTLNYYFHYYKLKDSIIKKANSDTAYAGQVIPELNKRSVRDRTYNMVNDMKSALLFSISDSKERNKEYRHLRLELHRKFSLSFACLILFFIGAPLGSIIRKGGLGMPLVVAIIFFIIFHLLNTFGEKFVKEGLTSPFFGMWLAVIVLAPVGVFFTYKAMNDSQLFNKEYYYRFFKKVRSLFTSKTSNIESKV